MLVKKTFLCTYLNKLMVSVDKYIVAAVKNLYNVININEFWDQEMLSWKMNWEHLFIHMGKLYNYVLVNS